MKTIRHRLFTNPSAFDFFQVVRLLERFRPRRKAIGRHHDPGDEIVRIKARPSLAFPASEIQELALVKEKKTPWTVAIVVNFMGLFGPLGALPQHYTERVAAADAVPAPPGSVVVRRSARAPALRAFLDIFNHRLVSLFFRAWEKYRITTPFERGEDDQFSDLVRSFVGIGVTGSRTRLAIPDETLLYYSGLLSKRPRSAAALEGVLEDHFDVPVEVVQFRGDWFRIDAGSLSRLAPGGRNRLGIDAGLWSRFWDPQVRFRVRMGPLTHKQFDAFLPSGDAHTPLVRFTRFFVGEEFGFDVQLVLRKDEIPKWQLGSPAGGRLGWSTWLATKPFAKDADDAVFMARGAETSERAASA